MNARITKTSVRTTAKTQNQWGVKSS